MRATAFTVYNTQTIEIFVERVKDYFEIWVVGLVKGNRMVLDHHVTHDDIEAHLDYAKSKDLIWRDASASEIPTIKHNRVVEMEKTIQRGTFLDYDDPARDEREAAIRKQLGDPPVTRSFRSVIPHLNSHIYTGDDKKDLNMAKKLALGHWTNGTMTLSFEPGNKFVWSCTDSWAIGYYGLSKNPDWWSFGNWCFHIMNSETQSGSRWSIVSVNEKELHLRGELNMLGDDDRYRFARIFRRVGKPETSELAGRDAEQQKPLALVSRAAGPISPILRRFGQSLRSKNPAFAAQLKFGLTKFNIRNELEAASVEGEVEPLVVLYSWRNGAQRDERSSAEAASIFPEDAFHFPDLSAAIENWKSINKAAEQLQTMMENSEAEPLFSQFSGRLFPIFDDGGGRSIALDLAPENGGRVVIIEFESKEPVRHAYDSFDEFLSDAIRANEKGIHLSCFDE